MSRLSDCLSDEVLSAALDGETTPESAEHLEACGDCRSRLARWREMDRALGGLPLAKEEAPRSLHATLRGLNATQRRWSPRGRLAAALSSGAVAAALSLALLWPDSATLAQGLAEEAVASHLRAFAAGNGSGCHVESESPQTLASWLSETLGHPVEVPASGEGSLVGARRCSLFGEETPAVVYRTVEAPVTVFLPTPGTAAFEACEKAMGQCTEAGFGQTVCVLPDPKGAPRVVVGALPADRLCEVVGT